MEETMHISLFLLHTVLVPGQRLPLKVFEARYLDMVSDCLKHGKPFGICLIQSGDEVGKAGEPHSVGTLARIEQWDMPKPGVLAIEVLGTERFTILDQEKHHELITATVEVWPTEPDLEIPVRYRGMVDFLKEVLSGREPTTDAEFESASWVSWKLAALLPVNNTVRQRWLVQRDPVMRLGDILDVLSELAESHH